MVVYGKRRKFIFYTERNLELAKAIIYEVWVSVPDDIEIPAPLIKRSFYSGVYEYGARL